MKPHFGATDIYDFIKGLFRKKTIPLLPAKYNCAGCNKPIRSMNIEFNEYEYPKLYHGYPICSQACEEMIEDQFLR